MRVWDGESAKMYPGTRALSVTETPLVPPNGWAERRGRCGM